MAEAPHHQIRRNLAAYFPSFNIGHDAYRWWVLGNIMIGTFMAVLDATIVNVGLPKIMATFGVDINTIEWILTAYLLVFAVILPISGWVADHFGYKRTYFLALFLFTLGSFLCGLAWDENILIFFRVIQGIGAGFLMPVGMAIVMREFPPNKRGIAMGFWSIAAAASVSFGPYIGGYLIDNISWRAIFYVNVPVGIIGMLATAVIQKEYWTEKVRSFDFIGFLSATVFLAFLMLALSEANAAWNIGGWTSGFIVTCLILSLIGLVTFMITELSIEHPIIELRLLKNFNFGLTNIVLFIFGLGMFGSTFLLPLYLQNSLGYTALQAGAVFLPVGILQGLTSPVSGYLSDKVNPKIPIITGMVLLSYSLYLNSKLSLFSMHQQIMFPLYLRGFAMGLLFAPLSSVALMEIPREKMAQASGLFNVIRQIGGSFGVAILGYLLTQRLNFHQTTFGQAVDQYSPAFQQVYRNLTHFASQAVGGTTEVVASQAKTLIGSHVIQQAYVQAIADDFFIAGAVSVLGIIPILFLRVHKQAGPKIVNPE